MPIDHLGLGVEDVDAAQAYYDEFMLEIVSHEDVDPSDS
jgi:catechol 2,3-dioxygenase-like lactoylglutathione lyase family enzyme